MANVLAVAKQHTIIVLAQLGRSQRQIAAELGIDRSTVKRYIDRQRGLDRPKPGSEAKPTIPITGSDDVLTDPEQARVAIPAAGTDSAKPTISTTGLEDVPADSGQAKPTIPITGSDGVLSDPEQAKPTVPIAGSAGRKSLCQPYEEAIKAGLAQGLSGQRIWQDIQFDHDFEGSPQSVRRFVRKLASARPLPFRRMECAPGEEAQIDFGTGAPIITPDGKRRRTHVLRVVLSHSRKGYSEVVFQQTTETFIRAIENAFHHFRGIPKTLVVDNLKAAVIKADHYDPDLNPKIRAFADYYGTVVLPTKSYTPRHKGKVERGVGYVQDNALKGKRFSSLQEQNIYLLDWERRTADTRIHGTTRKQVQKTFEQVERPALLPLPLERFPFFTEVTRKVNRDGHVEVDKAYYSVPPEYLTRQVWVRWNSRTVRIFNHRMEQIAFHVKHEPGRFSTQPRHIPAEKRSGIEKGAAYLLNKISLIGRETSLWAEQMIQDRGVEGVRVLQGLLNLSNRHTADAIEHACEIARTHCSYRLKTIRELIHRKGDRQQQFDFIEEHELIRPLADYEDFVHEALHHTTTNLKEQRA